MHHSRRGKSETVGQSRRRRQLIPCLDRLEGRELLSMGPGAQGDFGASIVDGQLAPHRPEVVRVTLSSGGYGSGTLITRRHVLTAAHVVDANDDFRYDRAVDGPVQVQFTNSGDVRTDGRNFSVTRVHVHPLYRVQTSNGKFVATHNDLAILELSTTITNVNPVPINRQAPRVGNIIEILGFGRTGTRESGQLENNPGLRMRGVAQIDHVSNDRFRWTFDQTGESNTAPGDSGGPGFLTTPGSGRVLAGVTSYGSRAAATVGAQSTQMRVDAFAPWIDAIIGLEATENGASVVWNRDISQAINTDYHLRVTYSNVNGINQGILDQPHIAILGPNNYYNEFPNIGLVIRSPNRTRATVDYQFRGPGGVWTSRDNGTYRVVLLNRGLTDSQGLPTGTTTLTSFRVNIPADSQPPTPMSSEHEITSPGSTRYIASVTFQDNQAFDPATFGPDDIRLVRADGGLSIPGRPLINNAQAKGIGTMLYEFPAPGGTWDAADNGTYYLRVQAGSVADVSGNRVAASSAGRLVVNIAANAPSPPWPTLFAPNINSPTSNYRFTITYRDDVAVNASTIPRAEVLVTFFHELSVIARLISVSTNSNAPEITATYEIPNFNFDADDNNQPAHISIGRVVGTTGVTDTTGNRLVPQHLGGFLTRMGGDFSGPRGQMSALNVSIGSDQPHPLAVFVEDELGVDATSFDASSLVVIGPDGSQIPVRLDLANFGQDLTQLTAGFLVDPPGGTWDDADAGIYYLYARDGLIRDLAGNTLPGLADGEVFGEGLLGAFEVGVRTDRDLPTLTATLNATDLRVAVPLHEFSVTYGSPDGIDQASLGNTDVYLMNDHGFFAWAKLVSTSPAPNNALLATYAAAGPRGEWGEADRGTYQLHLAGADAFNVRTVGGNTFPSQPLGTFVVDIPPPRVSLELGGPRSAPEGSLLSLAGARYTLAQRGDFRLDINWGDGSFQSGTLSNNALAGALDLSHEYRDDGDYIISVRIEQAGQVATGTTLARVSNVPPSAWIQAPVSPLSEGGSTTLRVTPTDPSAADRIAGFRYSLDIGADGSWETFDSRSDTLTIAARSSDDGPGVLPVRVRVTDKDGGAWENVVNIPLLNAPPFGALTYAEFDEGSPIRLVGDFSDPSGPDSASLLYSIDLGADGSFEILNSYDLSLPFPAPDGPASFRLLVRVTDKDGASFESLSLLNVRNLAPSVNLLAPALALAGRPFALSLAASDPGDDLLTALLDYGDGRSDTFHLPRNGSPRDLPVSYARPGTYLLTATVTDDDGASTTSSQLIQVLFVGLGLDDATRLIRRGRVGAIVLHFTDDLSPSSARNITPYLLFSAGRDRRFGTRDDQRIRLRSASFDPSSRRLTLTPSSPIAASVPLRLRVRGALVRSSSGLPLDANRDGFPGEDFDLFPS